MPVKIGSFRLAHSICVAHATKKNVPCIDAAPNPPAAVHRLAAASSEKLPSTAISAHIYELSAGMWIRKFHSATNSLLYLNSAVHRVTEKLVVVTLLQGKCVIAVWRHKLNYACPLPFLHRPKWELHRSTSCVVCDVALQNGDVVLCSFQWRHCTLYM